MQFYGVSGSGTYAVSFDTLDDVLRVLPNNDVNQISARNMRDVIYTLWLNGGGAGGEYLYTQGWDFSRKSTEVGGIKSGLNFKDVPLQQILDDLLFKQSGNQFEITGSGSFEYGFPNPTVNLSVKLTQNNDTLITTARVERTSLSDPFGTTTPSVDLSPPDRPVAVGTYVVTPYNNTQVVQNAETKWTLYASEGAGPSIKRGDTSATWYYKRFWGTINLYNVYGADFDISQATLVQKTAILNSINGQYMIIPPTAPNQGPLYPKSVNAKLGTMVWTSAQFAGATQPAGFKHIWFAFPTIDYTGGNPALFKDSLGNSANTFTKIGSANFTNQYGFVTNYTFWMWDLNVGPTSFTVV